MLTPQNFAEVMAIATQDLPLGDGLALVLEKAIELTGSRNAMVALLDEEDGVLEIAAGGGKEWHGETLGKTFAIDIEIGRGVVSTVAATGEAVLIADVTTDLRYRKMFASSRSELAVPIFDRMTRLRGVLNLESDREEHYDDQSQALAEGFAGVIAVLVMRDDRRRREEALIQIGSALDRSETQDDLIEKVLEVADEVLEFHSCSVFLLDRAKDLFVLRGTKGSLKMKVGDAGYQPDEGCTGWVCAHGEPLLIHEPTNDPRWRGRFIEFPTEQISSYLCVPIISRGRSIGALRVVRKKSENPYLDNRFTEDDQRLLTAIADQVAAGLESIRALEKALQIERMAAWGEMSAKSSHMIGNRVFALKGDVNELGHLLRDRPEPDQELLDITGSITNGVTRIEEILQDFRDYLTAAQVSLVRADLNFIVRESVMEIFPRRTQVKVKFDFDESLPEVLVDGNRIRRAIGEIVENALSFFEVGTFRVTTMRAEAEMLRRGRLTGRGEFLQVVFEDQGPGVGDESKESIFQPFFSTRVKGMGLGLSIVRGIAEAHGGTVLEVGLPGMGAKFVLLLPVAERR